MPCLRNHASSGCSTCRVERHVRWGLRLAAHWDENEVVRFEGPDVAPPPLAGSTLSSTVSRMLASMAKVDEIGVRLRSSRIVRRNS